MITIAGVGSPLVMLEYLVSDDTLLEILARIEKLMGRKVDALISAEIGGVNSMFPLALSAMTGLPVLDGDGVGRAVPRTEMCTFSIYGCLASPESRWMDSATRSTETIDDLTAEAVLRAATSALGAHLFGAFYPMTGKEAKATAVRGTVTQTQNIGRCIRTARDGSGRCVGELLAYLNSREGRCASCLSTGSRRRHPRDPRRLALGTSDDSPAYRLQRCFHRGHSERSHGRAAERSAWLR